MAVDVSSTWLNALILANRLALGWYVFNAGFEKVQREVSSGIGTFLRGGLFQDRSTILPEVLAVPFGYLWPWLEVVAGLLLVIGLFGRTAAAVNAWLLLSISIAMISTAGGDFFPRHYLMVFVPLAMLLALTGPGRYSIDATIRRRRRSSEDRLVGAGGIEPPTPRV